MLRITAFSHKEGTRSRVSGADLLSTSGGSQLAATALTFDTLGGHAYTVEEATDLAAKDWKPCAFTLPGSDTPVNVLSVPFSDGPVPRTVYLLPSNASKAFFRVRAE